MTWRGKQQHLDHHLQKQIIPTESTERAANDEQCRVISSKKSNAEVEEQE